MSSGHDDIVELQIPLRWVREVNVWLLRGDPLTLIDTGPNGEASLAALERRLGREGVRLEDLELVLGTHHHPDHVGNAAAIAERSGAEIAVLEQAAEYGARYEEHAVAERSFSEALMRGHGVPEEGVAHFEGFWEYMAEISAPFAADRRLREGDVLRAGGRELRVAARPGHSTSDTLFVDDEAGLAFVGDHLLAGISSATEVFAASEAGTRRLARIEYLESLERTARMPLKLMLTGHGKPITGHAELIEARVAEDRERCERILAELGDGPASAYELAARMWGEEIARQQPLLVIWEVLGLADLLISEGSLAEEDPGDGVARLRLV